MNVRMQQGKPAYSHVVTITGPAKMIYIAGQLARDVDGNIVGPGVRAARCADGDVCRPSLAAAHAGYQPPPRADPPVSRSRGIADANRGFLRLPARPRGGRRPLAPAHGFVRAKQCRALRADERPLLDGKGLRCLRAEIRDRPQDRARRYDRGVYEGSSLGPDRILRMFEERRGVVGDFELATSFRFGGIPFPSRRNRCGSTRRRCSRYCIPGRLRRHRRSSSGQRRNRCRFAALSNKRAKWTAAPMSTLRAAHLDTRFEAGSAACPSVPRSARIKESRSGRLRRRF